jgi:hypothetical protein
MKSYLWVLIIIIAVITYTVYYTFTVPIAVPVKKEEVKYATYDAVISGGPLPNPYADVWVPGDMSPAVLIQGRPTKDGREGIGHISSQTCYEADFASKNNRTGNFAQKTNNYKHEYPDSCSGTRQEIIGQFYN